ncbi:hypothetical protein VPNG_05284 [Cytospora leucostoma]|uniref:Xaa-Pro dipeptidyl-peptidase C-terminal domain-containing protein n=1 Tax=Cytospora leucostoma TaxID=1230097 RepID=A0A423X850_9PEZI|nr:hypothetical protein VPNG_05284 [Cytospora leucostoma]
MARRPPTRGMFDALVDRVGGWASGLPPETNSYTVETVRIPLEGEQDVEFAADLYRPITNGNPVAGTILVQSPYGPRFPFSFTLARVWAARGYNVLLVSVRGVFGSGGLHDPARQEVADGFRVVRWMRKQPWYTGTFATLGQSYLGFTQWALMNSGEPLDDYAAAIISAGPHDFSDAVWGTGAMWLPLIDWAENSDVTESQNWFSSTYSILTADPNGDVAAKKTVPLVDGAKKALGDESPTYKWLHDWLISSEAEIRGEGITEFWKPTQHGRALETTKVPILLVGGWQDTFTATTVYQYQRLRERGCTVGLTIGPWTHMEVGTDLKEAHDWLDKHLAKKVTGEIRQAPVKINVTGSNQWRWFAIWPPATKPLELYLASGGQLTQDFPSKSNPDEVQFTFDPNNPTPTVGGPLLFNGGYADDSPLAKRSDVLTFTTLPLDEDVEIHGKPHLKLLHSSDNPHVDLFVRLSEVNSKGASRNLCQAYRRLNFNRAPRDASQPVIIELDLSDCAHHFVKGTAIRLLVAGGNFPHYSYNLGSGENQATGTTLRPAKHTVHLGGSEGSTFVLPILAA